nr:MAG: RNA-dependent RNA polymerase [Mitovirus sp.]
MKTLLSGRMTKGLPWTIRRIKLLRLVVTRYLSGSPLRVVDELVGLRDGFPKCIWFLKELVDSGDPVALRLVITLMVVSRAMVCEAKPDYSSITAEFTGTRLTIDPDFVTKFVSDFNLVLFRPTFTRESFFFSMKGGPLGHPVLTAIHCLSLFDGPMWAAIVMIIGMPGAEYIKSLLMKYRKFIDWTIVTKKVEALSKVGYRLTDLPLRRLSIVQDPELKARIVGIVDWITQVILEPLSVQLFNLLRSIPQDRTFTQDPHIRKVEGSKFHSLDLSNATDRFPLTLQKQLLAEMLGPVYAEAWGSLLTLQGFAAPSGETIFYKVGQPMGARSSWAMFTLTHHLLVQYAAYLVGVYPFKDYILLGDDIVITNDAVAEKYVELITELGVGISPHKSHVSETTYEFAKRWFHNGVEVTGFPLNSVLTTITKPLELYTAVRTWVLRGAVPLNFIDSVECVRRLYVALNYSPRKLRAIENLLWTFRFTLRNLSSFNYDEVRAFFADATKDHGEYVIPASETMLESEFSRASSAVVDGTVIGLVRKLRLYQAELDKIVISTLQENDLPSNFDTSSIPLRDAILNSVLQLVEIGNNVSVWEDLLPLLEITTVVDLDQLGKGKRRSVVLLYRMSTFGKGLYNQLKFEPDYLPNITQHFRVKKSILDLKRSMEKTTKRGLLYVTMESIKGVIYS